MKCRKSLTDVETGGGRFSREEHGSSPGSCPRGIRHLGGAKSDQALVWNVRTCRPEVKGDVQAAKSARTRVPMRGTGTEQVVPSMPPANGVLRDDASYKLTDLRRSETMLEIKTNGSPTFSV